MQFVRSDGKMFFPANRAADYGVACFDLVAAVPCGYTQLSSPGTGSAVAGDYPAMIEGSAAIGTSLYFYGSENNAGVFTPIMYCFDAATQSPCASGARVDLSTPANGTVVAWNPAVNGANRGLVVQLTADGSRIYLDQAFSGPTGVTGELLRHRDASGLPRLGHAAGAADAELLRNGLRIVHPRSRSTWSPRDMRRLARRVPRAGAPRAAPREEVCVTADKIPLPPFPGPPGVPAVASLEQVTYVPQLDSSYFAFFDVTAGAPNGYAFCWNWTTNQACPGFNPARQLGHQRPAGAQPGQQRPYQRLRLHVRPGHRLHVGPG